MISVEVLRRQAYRLRQAGCRRLFTAVLITAVVVTSSPCSSAGSNKVVTISGSERLGWDQRADSADALASFSYAIFVDGAQSEMTDVQCASDAGPSGFPCSGALPPMSSGTHTLELATLTVVNDTTVQSQRSAPLKVRLVTSGSSMARQLSVASPNSMIVTTADDVQLRLDVIVDGLDLPTDLAFLPDGRTLIAEQAGRVRVVRDGHLLAQAALVLDDVTTAGQGGLLSLSVDPRFDQTHLVYAVYTTRGKSGQSTFSLARFRESNDTLADRMILLDNVPASPRRPVAPLRFGPDGKLYVGFDAGGDPDRSGDLASFNGKILRLNPDGSTPGDQAGYTPVYSSGYVSPAGLDWQSGTGVLWAADDDPGGSVRLSAVSPGTDRLKRGVVTAAYTLPAEAGASSLAFYRGASVPKFQSDLLIATGESGGLLRIRFNPQNLARISGTERLLQNWAGGIRVVSTTADGIYLCTPHELAKLTALGTER